MRPYSHPNLVNDAQGIVEAPYGKVGLTRKSYVRAQKVGHISVGHFSHHRPSDRQEFL